MSLPDAVQTITVQCDVVTGTGAEGTGTVTFVMPHALRDAADDVIVARSAFVGTLDDAGECDLVLPATTGPGITPTGWTYTVIVEIDGWRDRFRVALPHDGPAVVALSDLMPAVEPPDVVTFIAVGRIGQPGGVASLDDDGLVPAEQLPDGGGGGGVSSVNGDEGPDVVLTAADVGASATGHVHPATDVTSGTLAIGRIPTGQTGVTVPLGNDARFTDARTPTVHAASHAAAGADPITVAESQVTGLTSALAAKADLVGGVVPTAQIPAVAITDTYPAASQAAMLALTAQRGDVAIRSDNGRTYILATDSPGTLADWKELPAIGTVASVNNQQGVIVLAAADVGAPALSTLTAKGDIYVATGPGVLVRLPAGTDGQTLVADSTQTPGVKWTTLPSSAPGAFVARSSYMQVNDVSSARSAKAVTQDRMYLVPFALSFDAAVSGISFELTSSVPGTTALLTAYSIAAPYTLAVQVASLGSFAAATNTKIQCAVAQALSAGANAFGLTFQGGAPLARFCAGRNPYVSSATEPTGSGLGINNSFIVNGVSGAAPANVPLTPGTDSDSPALWAKF